ncbi:putative transcriptional regulator/transcriptional regulator with XRE-family HTH domain [Sphingomonas sp. BE138]|uniref:helix-turn-helix domain-containing protein n=1 Tax=Sphingomonas sp. BE138 TaxID=2817845 RepID=UPI0028631999|nr:short-chain fatty acyl-CoA regulator family protein [Sphingomonas sp. BE138]MDR6789761.1 putative transcriptional regulator/transcriptional regulator with XRE-family HTH domain [Sphingomonas sp. BE138]
MKSRLYAGAQLRALRIAAQLNQRAMAARLGLSVSYLSQLESDERPLTGAVTAALARHFPAALAEIEGALPARRLVALGEAFADPAVAPLPPEEVARLAEERPALADRLIALHQAKRAAEERVALAEEALTAGVGARLPWEAVRDWFHDAGNYLDPLDRAAEDWAGTPDDVPAASDARLAEALAERGVTIVAETREDAPLARFDGRALRLNAALPPESRRFLIANRAAALAFADPIAAIVADSGLAHPEARRLLAIGLANYAAGAMLMPYGAFRDTARAVRHDIDRLSRRFGTSFEQACHRLSTLQRPGAAGIPFYFCRVDMAGNITKRHSATRLQFARFGGACPLWHVHEAVAIPDRILVQHAETPDGVRYVSMAKGLVKPSGRFARAPRRYAVALGCEAIHAAEFVYADAVDLRTATPIGISCRLCPRNDCDQRAFPPTDRAIAVEAEVRGVVPYRVM